MKPDDGNANGVCSCKTKPDGAGTKMTERPFPARENNAVADYSVVGLL